MISHNQTCYAFLAVPAALVIFLALCQGTSGLTQAETLLKWKQSLPHQPILDSWMTNSTSNQSPCSWKGITCDSHGRVTIINLAYTGLEGTLQHLNFSVFPDLLRLDLKENSLTGPIPQTIGVLSKLQFLDLSTNYFNGTLPLSIANLTQVYELDVSRNDITGILDPLLFPDGSDNPKTGLIGIKNLLFQDTLLGGRIPNEIGNIRNLTVLALDGNSFFGPIPTSLGNCTHLSTLRMPENQLSGPIPPSIGKLTNLTDVRFMFNNLNGTVPQEFGNLSSLVVLHLAVNNFIGELPPQVCKSGKLVNFSAADNSFTGPIPVSLRNCPALYRVRIENNMLIGYADKDFGVYPNLTYMDFSNNMVEGELSSKWGSCKNLQSLKMAGNSVSGNIPGEIFKEEQLIELDLSSNKISGEIPPEIGNASNLNDLNLGNNKLSGMVPVEIGKLSNLRSLDLSMNMLLGPIPNQIGELSNLRSLNLSNNELNGTIPYQVGNLAELQEFLDLSENSLSGEIPSGFSRLSRLISLNISHNNLSGSIPDYLSEMVSLSSLNLSYNYLEGAVPKSGIFNSSHKVDLSNNKGLCGNVRDLQPCKVSLTDGGSGSNKNKVWIPIVASLGGVVFLSLVLVGVFFFCYKRKSRASGQKSSLKRLDNPFSIWYFNGRVVYGDIMEATKNFDDKYCIGEGSLGKVYKAVMQGGQVFAVKKLKCDEDSIDTESIKTFKSEIEAMTETRHRNIVKLYGFCSEGIHTFLVYEYMGRGNLCDMLRNDKEALELDWHKRVDVVKGVANALSYMHHDCVPPLIHRDISSNNVLLSFDLEAHVSDFGTARFLKHDSPLWTSFAGTYGYAAPDDGWSMLESDGIDDVTLLVNSTPSKMMGANLGYNNGFPSMTSSVLCAKASMLLQNVPPAILLRFLREHRSEWADSSIDAYSAAAIKAGPCSLPGARGSFGGQVILPLAHTIENEEFMEVIKLENMGYYRDDMTMPGDVFLLQLCSGVDEHAVGTSAELVFAPIDASFSDDAPILPSGFRIVPLDSGTDAASPNRTLDLASSLEVGTTANKAAGANSGHSGSTKSVMTIAFQFAFEVHLQDNIATMARQYVRSIVASVQRVSLALSPSRFGSQSAFHLPPGTPEAQTLARWICNSYRFYLGVEILKCEGSEPILKSLWHHSDAVLCCSLKALPVFTFANQAGLDMLETTLVALQDITLEKIFDDNGKKILCSEFPQIMQQGFMCMQGGICLSSMGRPISYERAVAWKVLNEEESAHCICFMFINWSFV